MRHCLLRLRAPRGAAQQLGEHRVELVRRRAICAAREEVERARRVRARQRWKRRRWRRHPTHAHPWRWNALRRRCTANAGGAMPRKNTFYSPVKVCWTRSERTDPSPPARQRPGNLTCTPSAASAMESRRTCGLRLAQRLQTRRLNSTLRCCGARQARVGRKLQGLLQEKSSHRVEGNAACTSIHERLRRSGSTP